MEWLKKIFKSISEIKQDSLRNDNILIGEQVIINLVKNGETIRTIRSEGHTWNSTGLGQIREWLRTGSANRPNSLTTNAGSFVAANPIDPGVSTVACWLGTFVASGALSNITDIRLNYGATAYATFAVTTFTKPDGIQMDIRWESTISGV